MTANFLAFPSVKCFENWLSSNHIQFLSNTSYLLKFVRANLIYLQKRQITEYWQNRLNDLDFLPFQNVRQCRFHNMAQYLKKSLKESITIKEFRPKIKVKSLYLTSVVLSVTKLVSMEADGAAFTPLPLSVLRFTDI